MEPTLRLIERVVQATSGTIGDPLSHDEVRKVVEATIREVQKDPEQFIPLFTPEV